jgi:hypothetical protein
MTFFVKGFEIIFRVALALLDYHKEHLMMLDMEGMLKYFQKDIQLKHEQDHETILMRTFAIRYNSKKMKKFEKDYLILKRDEQEEQAEIKRIKSDNKILKQRIEELEKENVQLAQRLIEGQIINAQSMETIIKLTSENNKQHDLIEKFKNDEQIINSGYLTNEIQLLNDRIDCLVRVSEQKIFLLLLFFRINACCQWLFRLDSDLKLQL